MLATLPLPCVGDVLLYDDYYVTVVGFSRHARGYQVHFTRAGQTHVHTAGFSEFAVGAVVPAHRMPSSPWRSNSIRAPHIEGSP